MTSDQDRIQLVIPAAAEYLVLARLTAAGIAGRLGMSYEDVEDLRVIASETCRLLMGDNGAAGTVTLSYVTEGQSLEIVAVGETDPMPATPEEDDLSLHLLAALADDHDVSVGGGEARIRVVKRASA